MSQITQIMCIALLALCRHSCRVISRQKLAQAKRVRQSVKSVKSVDRQKKKSVLIRDKPRANERM